MDLFELDIWTQVHGKPLTLGTKVKVTEKCEYAADWRGEFVVVGINWDKNAEKVNITLDDEGTHYDGFKLDELLPIN